MMLAKFKNNTYGICLLCFCLLSFTTLYAQDDEPQVESKPVKPAAAVKTSETEVLITGKVTDAATKKPVNAAEISAGEYSSAITKEDGLFEIKAPYGTDVLKIKAWGYQQKEVALQGKTSVEIQLISDQFSSFFQDQNLPFGTGTALSLPYSDAVMRDFFPAAVTSIEERMKFKLGEIRSISRSGFPTVGSNQFIRGLNSIMTNAQPLILVDGVPYENFIDITSIILGSYANPLSNIDMDDIDNITLIKDGYALYGMKGANGVISITTKRAKELTSRIAFTASWGANTAPKKIPVMNADQFRVYASDLLSTIEDISSESVYDVTQLLGNTGYRYNNNTDWQDVVFQNGLIQDYHGEVTGGDDVAKYAMSLGYMDIEGTVKDTKADRFNARFNTDIEFVKDLHISLGLSYSQLNKNVWDDGVSVRSSPSFLSLIKSPMFFPNKVNIYTGMPIESLEDVDDFNVGNPMCILQNGVGDSKQYRIDLYGKMRYNINKAWSVKATFGYNFDKLNESYFLPDKGTANMPILEYNRPGSGANYISLNVAKSSARQFVGIYSELSGEFAKTIDFIHKVRANAGIRYQSNTVEQNWGIGYNTPQENPYLQYAALGLQIYDYKQPWKWNSAFIDGNYTLKERYILSASLSADGTSKAGDNNKYGAFPSAGLAWRASSESFMSGWAVDVLQFRVSAGLTGNDDMGGVSPTQYFSSVSFMNTAGLVMQNLENKDLKWETTLKLNAGIDLALLNERVSVSADVYKNETRDLITRRDASYVSGFDYLLMNGGKLENTGIEIGLQTRIIDTKNFKFGMDVKFAKYKNEVTALPDNNKDIVYTFSSYGANILTRVGQPVGVFYGYKTKGVFATAEQAANAAGPGKSLYTYYLDDITPYTFGAGDMYFDDKNGDGEISEKDLQIIGDPNPDFYGTLALNFAYKSFGLNLLFSGVYGNDIYNYLRSKTEAMSGFYNQSKNILNRWKAEGQVTNVPKATYMDLVGNARFSDRWIEDGSYLRLQNLTFSWKFPKRVLFVDGLTVFATANNVFTWTKYLGSDPESSVSTTTLLQGIDGGLLSQGRSFMGGIKINL